jgi:hypothetical protein
MELISLVESKLVFDFLPVDDRPTLLDSSLIVHWREVEGTKVTSIFSEILCCKRLVIVNN